MTSIFRRHTRGRPPHPDVLTPAEWRVLEEVRRGRSNPEIADRLGLSRNTVKTHVSSILDKLELRDRGDLAAWQGTPAQAQRSRLLAPLAWLASKTELVVMSAAAAVLVTGLVVALQSGLLTNGPSEVGVLPAATAEVVSTPAGGAPIPDCPVLDEVCELAVEFLPLVRAADGQAIASRATTQTLACPVMMVGDDGVASGPVRVCEGQVSGAAIDVYQLFNGKAVLYVADAREFGARLSEGLQYNQPLRLVAVSCLTDEAQRLECERGAVAVYAGPTPSPAASGSGKPGQPADPPMPALMALLFNRHGEGQWYVETFMARLSVPINSFVGGSVLGGTNAGIYTDGAWREVSLFAYDFS